MKKQSAIVRDEVGRQRVLDVLRAISLEKPIRVEWGRQTNRRTLSQNALMWMWHGRIASETGHTADEVHEVIKELFCAPREIEIAGTVQMIRSTKLLNTVEMTEFMDNYYAWACTQGWFLPVPEELGRAA